MANRDSKTAGAEFRELIGMEFDELPARRQLKVLVALSKFAESVDITVLRLAGESHPLFQQQRDRLVRALRAALQRKDSDTAERRRLMTEVVWLTAKEMRRHEERVIKIDCGLMPLGDILKPAIPRPARPQFEAATKLLKRLSRVRNRLVEPLPVFRPQSVLRLQDRAAAFSDPRSGGRGI